MNEEKEPKLNPERKYRMGDLVRIVGFNGRLFGNGSFKQLAYKEKIRACVELLSDEDKAGDVQIPDGILADSHIYISIACIELVKPVEEIKPDNICFVKENKENKCFEVHNNSGVLASFYYGPEIGLTKEEAFYKAGNIIIF